MCEGRLLRLEFLVTSLNAGARPKGSPHNNILLLCGLTPRRDGVVPLGVCAVSPEIDLLHFCVGYLNTGLIESRVQLGLDPKAGRGARGTNQVDHSLIAHQRFALPVQTDEGEHAVLDLVPLAGTRWIVTHGDGQAGLIRELLQVILPCPIPATITSPAVGAE